MTGLHTATPALAFVASPTDEAQQALEALRQRHREVPMDEADAVVALGGDGLMLQTLHRLMDRGTPIYGMNRGSVGFLMNDFRLDGLLERILAAERSVIHPLRMAVMTTDGTRHGGMGINEVYLFRQTYQAAKLRVAIDGHVRVEELIADGILVATPAGSTAYNLSANGPILPLRSRLLAMTPISPFRPRRWRGALLPEEARVVVEVLEPERRPVAAVADHNEIRGVREVAIAIDRSVALTLLHDPGHGLEERILREQFGF